MKVTAVIMAGGRGERFWPKSRNSYPKQFLSLTSDGETMIQKTVKRLLPIVAYEDIFIVTNENYVPIICTQLPEIPVSNILAEPVARNTAPCIALAAAAVNKKYDDAVMIVLPSDHLIKYDELYINTMKHAVKVAQKEDNLVTVGITPTYPETGYGYIKFSTDENDDMGVYKVEKFVEKPCLDVAKEYLNSGKYLWNSGMFVWKVSSICKNLQKFLPTIYEGMLKIKDSIGTDSYEQTLSECFESFPSESIDFGIMEKADNIYTLSGSFGWDDVGSWLALEKINKTDEYGNYVSGDVITINTNRSIICSNKKLIASVGLDDIIVVDTDDAILVCDKEHTQEVKKVIENLKICNRRDLI
ncbi:MAG: mannose-1-phosphate guanylyltransferase [Oscillospiraceae bacterium]|nr:mannose-1-phosphate guanylyltransferase [Oscillospiraceae bacterium]